MTDEKVWVGDEYRELDYHERESLRNGRKILKTNSRSEHVYIDHPDIISGMRKKIRRKPSNITKPKKKRK